MERTFDDLIKALMEDETWEIPMELRAMYLRALEWRLNKL